MGKENHILNSGGYMRLPQVLQIYPVSKSTWWQGVKDGIYPQPVKLSRRTTAWRTQDIHLLIQNIEQGGATHEE